MKIKQSRNGRRSAVDFFLRGKEGEEKKIRVIFEKGKTSKEVVFLSPRVGR